MNEVRLPSNWSEWKIVQYLGSGAYGNVYKAERVLGEKRFYSAIKIIQIPETDNEVEILRREYSTKEKLQLYYQDIVKSCVDEIKTMDLLKGCSHIVSIEDYQVVEEKNKMGWKLFIRMEYLQCFTEYIQTHPLSETEVIKVGIDICEALEACEKMNVLHRDIKPDNIFVSSLGFVKLGDFGVARQLEKTRGLYSMKGTQTYMAPEIFRGEEYGKATDIYSLGLVLYELMNRGRAPFIDLSKQMIYSRDKEEALVKRMSGDILPKPAEASEKLSAVILKACAFEPVKRYQKAADLKKDLQELQKFSNGDLENKKKRNNKPVKKIGVILLTALILAGLGVSGRFWIKERAAKEKEQQEILGSLQQESELMADISSCADFIIYETGEGGSTEKFLFQKKIKEVLKNQKFDAETAENLMKDISIEDFVISCEKQIPKGTSVTMSFHGVERIKERYHITLIFDPITKVFE